MRRKLLVILVILVAICITACSNVPVDVSGANKNDIPSITPLSSDKAAYDILTISNTPMEDIKRILSGNKLISELYVIGDYNGKLNTSDYSADTEYPVRCITSGIYAKDKSDLEYDSNCVLEVIKAVRELDNVLCNISINLHYNEEYMSNMGYEREDFLALVESILTNYIGEYWSNKLVYAYDEVDSKTISDKSGKKYEFISDNKEHWEVKLLEDKVKGSPNYMVFGINLLDYIDSEHIRSIRKNIPGFIGNELEDDFKCKLLENTSDSLVAAMLYDNDTTSNIYLTGEVEYNCHIITIPGMDKNLVELSFDLKRVIQTLGDDEYKPELNLNATCTLDPESSDDISFFVKGRYDRDGSPVYPREQRFKDWLLDRTEAVLGESKVYNISSAGSEEGQFYYPEMTNKDGSSNLSYYSYGNYNYQVDESNNPIALEFLIGAKEWRISDGD